MEYNDTDGKKLKIKDRKIALYSIKDIYSNEELLSGYGDAYWTTRFD
jgi:SET domain-containing protein